MACQLGHLVSHQCFIQRHLNLWVCVEKASIILYLPLFWLHHIRNLQLLYDQLIPAIPAVECSGFSCYLCYESTRATQKCYELADCHRKQVLEQGQTWTQPDATNARRDIRLFLQNFLVLSKIMLIPWRSWKYIIFIIVLVSKITSLICVAVQNKVKSHSKQLLCLSEGSSFISVGHSHG